MCREVGLIGIRKQSIFEKTPSSRVNYFSMPTEKNSRKTRKDRRWDIPGGSLFITRAVIPFALAMGI